jgi:hypothetical protein
VRIEGDRAIIERVGRLAGVGALIERPERPNLARWTAAAGPATE